MDLMQLLNQKISTFQQGYYLWIVAYGFLGLGSIIGSGLAATSFPSVTQRQVAAGIGALCAAVFGFLQPNTYATSFDVALRIARNAQIDLIGGRTNPQDVA